MTTADSTTKQPGSLRIGIQKFGTFLSGMIMPNIAAFIAWGLITALFIATGWLGGWEPVAPILGGFGDAAKIGWEGAATQLAEADGKTFPQYVGLVGSMITYLLPLLIANTGGRMVYGERGGVVASIATMGVIVGTDIPMFMGAMIMGPLAAWVTKQMDRIWEDKVKAGFEMLVNNFSAGILGMLLAILGFFIFGPVMRAISGALGAVVDWLVQLSLLPLLSIIVEPAKVLFLNNAINHGVFTPIGTNQALQTGKSVLFLIEANPGPGVGILLAFTFFGVGAAKASAPGAAIIQFFGGIHEIYFPYVLMKPALFLAAIAGGATGVLTNVIFHSGLRAPAAPGSIIAVLIQTTSDSYVGVILSVILAATVSFLVTAVVLRASRARDLAAEGEDAFSAAVSQTSANKGKESAVLGGLGGTTATAVQSKRIEKVIFACDAGMGSSAMGATVLRNKFKEAGITDLTVTNRAIANLDGTADLVITQNQLTDRARGKEPEAVHVSVDNFMNSPRYDEVVELVREQRAGGPAETDAGAGAAAAGAGAGAADGAGAAGAVGAEDAAGAGAAGAGDAGADAAGAGAAGAGAAGAGAAGAGAAGAGAAGAGAAGAGAAGAAGPRALLTIDRVRIHPGSATQDEALIEASGLLQSAGAVTAEYLDAMRQREATVSTFMGNGLAIPHGTNEAKDAVLASALSVVRYDGGVDWAGDEARFVIGIAGVGDEHLEILAQIATLFADEDEVAKLKDAQTPEELLALFTTVNEG